MPRISTHSVVLLLGILLTGSGSDALRRPQPAGDVQGAGQTRPGARATRVQADQSAGTAVVLRSSRRGPDRESGARGIPEARQDDETIGLSGLPLRRPEGPRFAADHIVVQFAAATGQARRQEITWSLGGVEYRPAQWGDFGRVAIRASESPEDVARRFRSNPDVVRAEPDPLVYAAGTVAAQLQTDDPFVARQWHLDRIRLEQALQLNSSLGRRQDGRRVVVAVIDTGVLFGSDGDCEAAFPRGRGPDLQGATFVPGFDFVNRGTPPWDEGSFICLQRQGDRCVLPGRFGHGTFVTTLIAAQWNNRVGGAGVSPEVAIMPLRVLGTSGEGSFSAVAEAINFAVQNGADVINMSLGGPQGSSVAADAIRRAHAAGVVVVAASGNEADEPDAPDDVSFPARYPEVIAVGATAFNDARASYSNFGPGLDLMAPAGEDGGPVSGNLVDGLLSGSFLQRLDTGQVACGSLEGATGTSFAAPQVAAAAALLKAIGVQDPETIRTLLQNGARDIGPAGFDNENGHGLMDIFEAHEGFGFSFE